MHVFPPCLMIISLTYRLVQVIEVNITFVTFYALQVSGRAVFLLDGHGPWTSPRYFLVCFALLWNQSLHSLGAMAIGIHT